MNEEEQKAELVNSSREEIDRVTVIAPPGSVNLYVYFGVFFYSLFAITVIFLIDFILLYPNIPYRVFQSTDELFKYSKDIFNMLVSPQGLYVGGIIVSGLLSTTIVIFRGKLKFFKVTLATGIIFELYYFAVYTLQALLDVNYVNYSITKTLLHSLFLVVPITIYLLVAILISFVLGFLLRWILNVKSIVIKIILLLIPFLIFVGFFTYKVLDLNKQSFSSVSPQSMGQCEAIKSTEYANKCFFDYAIKNNNLDACNHIYLIIGMWQPSSKDCSDKVIESLYKADRFNVLDCENFTESKSKSACYMYNAVKKVDFNICDKDDSIRSSCYYYVGDAIVKKYPEHKELADCVIEFWKEYRNDCFKWNSIIMNDSTICGLIDKDSQELLLCNRLASSPKAVKECGLMTLPEARNRCFYNEAYNKKDTKICDFLNKDSIDYIPCTRMVFQ